MADAGGPVLLKGKDLNDYRVVDLKKECDKRSLSKNGNKQEIVERLRTFLREEQQKENRKANDDDGHEGGDASEADTGQNDVVKSYLQKQKKLLEDRQQEIKRFSEESASEDNESPTKKDKPVFPVEKESDKISQDVGAGDTRSSRRRSNSSNHSNADENVPEVTSPQQRPRRGWRKSSKEETTSHGESLADAPRPDEGKAEAKTKDEETKRNVNSGIDKKIAKSDKVDEIQNLDNVDEVQDPNDTVKIVDENVQDSNKCSIDSDKAEKVPDPIEKAVEDKDSSISSKKTVEEGGKENKIINLDKPKIKKDDPVEEKSTVSEVTKKRSSSSSSERSNKNSPERTKTRQRSESGSSSDRSRSKKKRISRASSSSSSGSRDRSPRRRKSRSSSSSRSRSRSRTLKRRRSTSRSVSPAKQGSIQSKAQTVKRKSRSKDRSRSRSPPSKRRSRSSSSRSKSRSPSPKSKQKNPSMEVSEPVSTTTQDIQVKESVATIEKEDEDIQPDTTVESISEKEVDGEQSQTSDISPEKSVQRITTTGEDEKGEGEKLEDKENVKEKPVRKRKWGSKTGKQTGAKRISSINISTDSLKGIIPDIKLTEPILDLGNDDDKISDIEEDKRDVKIRRTVVVKADEQKELEEGEAPDSPEEGEAGEEEEEENKNMDVDKDQRKVKEVKAEPVIIRRVSQKKPLIEAEEPSKVRSRSPSPARNALSTIVHVRNLVRPFTVLQLKELLKRHGSLVDDKFWIDSIKSHCYATFETEEAAAEARKALHGTKWPSSNPKILQVDYATQEEIEYHKNEEEAPRLAREKALKETKARKEEEKKRKAEREARLAKKKEEETKKRATHVREWDRDKIRQSEERDEAPKKRRPSSESPVKDKRRPSSESPVKRRRERSREKEKERPVKREKTEKKEDEEPPAKLLDDLFKKTKATPCIYWLPLTEAQAAEKAKEREAERERRMKEREKRKSEPSPPHRPMERDRRPMRSPPVRGRMDDWSRRRSPDRRPPPDIRDRRR